MIEDAIYCHSNNPKTFMHKPHPYPPETVTIHVRLKPGVHTQQAGVIATAQLMIMPVKRVY